MLHEACQRNCKVTEPDIENFIRPTLNMYPYKKNMYPYTHTCTQKTPMHRNTHLYNMISSFLIVLFNFLFNTIIFLWCCLAHLMQ